VVARHVNKENEGRTTHFGCHCFFPLTTKFQCCVFCLFLFMQSRCQRQLTAQTTQQYDATLTRLLRIQRRIITCRGRIWRSWRMTEQSNAPFMNFILSYLSRLFPLLGRGVKLGFAKMPAKTPNFVYQGVDPFVRLCLHLFIFALETPLDSSCRCQRCLTTSDTWEPSHSPLQSKLYEEFCISFPLLT